MGVLKNLAGTVLAAFGIGRVTLDASAATAARTITLPDASGQLALRAQALKIASLRA